MAVTERAYTGFVEPEETVRGFAYRADAPAYEPDERGRIRRTRERPQLHTEPTATTQGLTTAELRQLMVAAVFVTVMLIGLLVLNACAANLQCDINNLTKANLLLEDEIDAMSMKIDQGTSIEVIESYAMGELNMEYPSAEQCIYIAEDVTLMENFSDTIRRKAYE